MRVLWKIRREMKWSEQKSSLKIRGLINELNEPYNTCLDAIVRDQVNPEKI
jgi:hypothetical protein